MWVNLFAEQSTQPPDYEHVVQRCNDELSQFLISNPLLYLSCSICLFQCLRYLYTQVEQHVLNEILSSTHNLHDFGRLSSLSAIIKVKLRFEAFASVEASSTIEIKLVIQLTWCRIRKRCVQSTTPPPPHACNQPKSSQCIHNSKI